jgi:NADH-quinone oxidoreductase subunit L
MPLPSWAPLIAIVGPFLLALVLGVGGGRMKPIAPWVAAVAPILVLWVGVASLLTVAEKPAATIAFRSGVAAAGALPWFEVAGASIGLSWSVDSLAALMLVVVGVVALCVVVFSAGYMHGDPGWVRYFALLALFTGSMTMLVVSDNLAGLFVGWELVGACSYLLIGFWYAKPEAAKAAIKAFLTTRVGDVGLLLGLGALWGATGSLDYATLMPRIAATNPNVVTLAAVLIAIGAMGKSAQFPLHAWLPDAMEGPTPVSALIHAATMVAAGVFLVARVWPLFEASEAARMLLLVAGTVSALGAATIAVAQRDIKKVLAYSTISQLGIMFAALGVGAWEAAFFHLVTHAAFKALLFLASGSVIHGSGTQDLHYMGGLRKPMKATFAVWVIGSLALAGIVPFAGFFSKDAVLDAVLKQAPIAGLALLAASTLTALYMARATRLAFFGEPAEGLHAHESPLSMLLPLIVLAVPATVLGFASGTVSELLHAEAEPLQLVVSATAVGLAVLGGVIGWVASAGVAGDLRLRDRLGPAWGILAAAYRWDDLVDAAVVRPTVSLSRALWAFGDRMVADGVSEGLGREARRIGRGLSIMQTGDAQGYATVIAVAVMVMLLVTVWAGR